MSVIKIAIAVLRHPNILSYKRNSDNFCKGSAGVSRDIPVWLSVFILSLSTLDYRRMNQHCKYAMWIKKAALTRERKGVRGAKEFSSFKWEQTANCY